MTRGGESRRVAAKPIRTRVSQERQPRKVTSQHIPNVNRTESKQNPANLVKNAINIGTWNVLSLVSTTSKLHELSEAITEFRLDVLALTETHIPGTTEDVLENGSLLINSGRKDGQRRQGVGLVLSKKLKNSLISYTPISERVLTARLHSRHVNISIVVGYAPTETSEDKDKDSFYEQLTDTFSQLPSHDIKILMGDLNARLTSEKSAWPGIIGPYSLHDDSNDNGNRLLSFCAMFELTVGGTLQQHADIHKGTWRSPDGKTVTQIDHICISKKWRSTLLDVRSYRGADIGSDHYLVRGKMRVRLMAVKRLRALNKRHPAIENLKREDKRKEYNIALKNRFEVLQEEEHPDEEWENIKKVISDVSIEVLGERPRLTKEQHLSQITRDLMSERKKAKRKNPTQDSNRTEYSRLNKMVRKSVRADDENHALRMANDLECASRTGNQREVWSLIRKLSGRKTRMNAAVRDKNGKQIGDKSAQTARWREYFEELLNSNSTEIDLSALDNLEVSNCFTNLTENDGPPTQLEIEAALITLKNNKSPGIDAIMGEQLKYGAKGLCGRLETFFAKLWNQETLPNEWLKGVITIIPKKGDTSQCSNNRGITLRSTSSKVLQIIILRRMSTGIETLLRENQCGFRVNRSCTDQIYALRRIINESIEFNLPLYINFIDFKAAFDSINRGFIWRALEHYGLPNKYIRMIKAFYNGTVSAVKH